MINFQSKHIFKIVNPPEIWSWIPMTSFRQVGWLIQRKIKRFVISTYFWGYVFLCIICIENTRWWTFQLRFTWSSLWIQIEIKNKYQKEVDGDVDVDVDICYTKFIQQNNCYRIQWYSVVRTWWIVWFRYPNSHTDLFKDILRISDQYL